MLQLYFIHYEKVSRCLDLGALSAVSTCSHVPACAMTFSMNRVLISIETSLVLLLLKSNTQGSYK